MIDGETGWDTELKGSLRSPSIKEPFLCVFEEAIVYPKATAIKKGIWMYDAILLCEREDISIDKTKRKMETATHYYLRVSGLLAIFQKVQRFFSLN